MVVWRKKAVADIKAILQWMTDEGHDAARRKLLADIDEAIEKASNHPTIGKPSQKRKAVRSVRIDKNRRLYYSAKGSKLFIVQVFDSRQDPGKNRY